MQRRVSFVIFLSLVLSVALGAGLLWAEDLTPKDLVAMAKAEITSIDVAKGKSIFDQGGYLFIDVREPAEYKMGHIPGAINIPRGLVEFKIAAEVEEKDAKVVVYCKSGGRSSLATQSLEKLGYTALLNMDGGWLAWEKAEYPVE